MGQAPKAVTQPVSRFYGIVYIITKVDADFTGYDKKKVHIEGSAPGIVVDDIKAMMAVFRQTVHDLSGGLAELELKYVVDDDPITKVEGEPGHETPIFGNRIALLEADSPRKYFDSVFMFYYHGKPGAYWRGDGGSGGGGIEGTSAAIPFDDNFKPKATFDAISGFLHEWVHGIDGFFSSEGYNVGFLHEGYQFGYAMENMYRPPQNDSKLWVSRFRGTLFREWGQYGYSKSVWMSGTPRGREPNPPIQLLWPPDKTVWSHKPVFKWAGPGADRLRLEVFKEGVEAPVETRDVGGNEFNGEPLNLDNGKYRWHVVATRNGVDAPIGDEYSFTIGPQPEPKIKAITFSERTLPAEGGCVRVRATVPTEPLAQTVWAELLYPGPRTITFAMNRDDLNIATEGWFGIVALPQNRTSMDARYKIRICVRDFEGRETKTKYYDLIAASENSVDAYEGLRAEYYYPSKPLKKAFQRLDKDVDFFWNGASPFSGQPDAGFRIEFNGSLLPPRTANYRFLANFDGRFSVDISEDGVNWVHPIEAESHVNPAEQRSRASYRLDENKRYRIRATYLGTGKTGKLQLMWQIGTDAPEVIPPECMRPDKPVYEIDKPDPNFVYMSYRSAPEIAYNAVRAELLCNTHELFGHYWIEFRFPDGHNEAMSLRGREYITSQAYMRRPPHNGVMVLPENNTGEDVRYRLRVCARQEGSKTITKELEVVVPGTKHRDGNRGKTFSASLNREKWRYVRLHVYKTNTDSPCKIDEIALSDASGANITRRCYVTASSGVQARDGKYDWRFLTDGRYGPGSIWTASDTSSQWILLDCNRPTPLGTLYWSTDRLGYFYQGIPADYDVEVSNNLTAWKVLQRVRASH